VISVNKCRPGRTKRESSSLFLFSEIFVIPGNLNAVFKLIAILYALLYFNCATYKISTGPLEWQSPEEVITYYNNYFSRLNTFKGEGTLQIESSQLNERIPMEVLFKSPDSLKIKLEGPVGIDIAEVFIDRKNYLIYLPREEQVFSGNMIDLDLDELLYDLDVADLNLRGENFDRESIHNEIIGFFQGGMPLNLFDIIAVNFIDSTRRNNLFKLQNTSSDIVFEFPLKSADLRKIYILGENGNRRVEKSFSRYVNKRGVRIPRRIKYLFPEERIRISIQYTNVIINNKINPREFHIEIPIKIHIQR